MSLKTKLFCSVYSVIVIILLFSSIMLLNTIRSYDAHYYRLVSSFLKLGTDTIVADLKNYEKVAADISINDSVQAILSDVKDSGTQLRMTTASSIRNILSQNALRLNNLNTIIAIPADKSTVVIQAAINKGEDDYLSIMNKYLLLADALDENEHGKWITDYCSNGHLMYVCRINRIANVKLDTIGYLVLDIDLESFFNFESIDDFIDDYSFVMEDEEYKLVYKTTDRISTITEDIFIKAVDNDYLISYLNGGIYFIVASSYSQWRFTCLVQYSDLIGWLFYLIVLYVVLAFVLVVIIFGVITKLYRNIYGAIDALRLKFLLFSGEDVTLPDKSVWDRSDELGDLHDQFDRMTERVKSLTEAKLEAEMDKKRTYIEMLQLQISPHFVLNALQMLDWRAKKQKDKELSLMIESLGRILQVSLSKENQVYLDTELNLVQEYIYIQQKRNPEREINLVVDITDDSLYGLIVPKFSIQPLVENACRYASVSLNKIDIFIKSYIEDGKLYLKVSNTGSTYEPDLIEKLLKGEVRAHGNGIGMMNILKRIEYSYGSSYGLSTDNDDGMATVTIILPVISEDESCIE